MAYAILRIAKLKTKGNVSSSLHHNFRTRETLNADSSRTALNTHLYAQNSSSAIKSLNSRLATQEKIRSNAVLAVEYLITASPEFFKENSDATVDKYFHDAVAWLKKKHGEENILCISRHNDETSPHLCAYVVPIDPRGKLNASHYFDGREKLSEMQTDFASVCGYPVQLERGVEGSSAKHTTIKQYYARLNAKPEPLPPVPAVKDPTIGERLAEVAGIETEHSRQVEQAEKAKKKRQEKAREQAKIRDAKAKAYDIEQAKKSARDVDVARLREQSTRIRALPLEAVLERLGCVRDPKDKANWKTPAGRLTVTGAKFFAHDLNKGGGGAIDLIMCVEDLDFRGAVSHAVGLFGATAVTSDLAHVQREQVKKIEEEKRTLPKPKFTPPAPSPAHWPRVRAYLTKTRRLAEKLVDDLHAKGIVYADKFANAVFVLARGLGVELRGTGPEPFHGFRGEKAPFILPSQGPKEVAFVESSIDALSFRELGFDGEIVSMGGSSSERAKALADAYRARGFDITSAHDNDHAGEAQAKVIAPCHRITPRLKDWNDDLITEKSRKDHRSSRPVEPRSDSQLQSERYRENPF